MGQNTWYAHMKQALRLADHKEESLAYVNHAQPTKRSPMVAFLQYMSFSTKNLLYRCSVAPIFLLGTFMTRTSFFKHPYRKKRWSPIDTLAYIYIYIYL